MSAMANTPVMPTHRGHLAGHAGRVAWTIVGLVLAVTGVSLWVGFQIRTQFQNSYAVIPVHARFFPDAVHRVVIGVESGTVTIEHTSGPTTIVDTTGTRSSRRPSDDEHLIGSTLYLRSACGTFMSTPGYCIRDYRVRVPGDVTVVASISTGSLFVSGMHGSVNARVGIGNVSAIGDVGPLHASTQSGSIIVRREDGALDVANGTGNVLVTDARGPSTVQLTNGSVAIVGASTSVHVTVGTGQLTATGLTGSAFSSTVVNGSIALTFTVAPRQVDASIQTGPITVHVPYGSARYQVHLKSGTGRVASDIPSDPSSTRVIRVLTGNGNVFLGVSVAPSTPTPPLPPATPSTPKRPGFG